MPALLDEPDLPGDLRFVFDAFWRLHTDRPTGSSVSGPIPNRDIVAEANRMSMGADEGEWFHSLISAMDRVYLGWVDGQRKQAEARDRA